MLRRGVVVVLVAVAVLCIAWGWNDGTMTGLAAFGMGILLGSLALKISLDAVLDTRLSSRPQAGDRTLGALNPWLGATTAYDRDPGTGGGYSDGGGSSDGGGGDSN